MHIKQTFGSYEINLVNVSFAKSTWAVVWYPVFNTILNTSTYSVSLISDGIGSHNLGPRYLKKLSPC